MGKGLAIAGGVILLLIIIVVLTSIGTYNGLVSLNEEVNQNWSQVENQYQRRSDLIPNLVNTVKGYADFEKEVLTAVTEARAKVSQMNITPELINDPQAFAKFQAAQGELTSALSRLLVTVENYPNLKANESFLKLQDELAGTENRIATARRDFNTVVQRYNSKVKSFPTVIFAGMLGFGEKQYFKADAGADQVPKVEF